MQGGVAAMSTSLEQQACNNMLHNMYKGVKSITQAHAVEYSGQAGEPKHRHAYKTHCALNAVTAFNVVRHQHRHIVSVQAEHECCQLTKHRCSSGMVWLMMT
jgi:hypothetical protein